MKDNKKTNKTRRNRGYNWEKTVALRLEKLNFIVERLGGTTTKMPDLVAHNDDSKTIIGIECKSTSSKHARVPVEQMQRCIDEVNKWGLYTNKKVILAFQFNKFGKVKDVNHREKREYFKVWNIFKPSSNISCNYDGVIRSTYEKIELEDYNIE